jgi:uncharacterized protein
MSGESLKLVCVGCGASLEYSATDRALKCPYCGKVTDIPGVEEDAPEAAQAIVPLTVDVTALTDAVYRHLASGDMTPDHLLEHASITKKDRFYVPAFCFHGNFDAKWTASFGYDRTEHYTEYESRYENGRTVRVPVNKTRTVTDWRPVNGTDTGAFAVLAYAGTKLLGSSLKLTQLVEGGATDVVPYDPSFVSGFQVEEFQHAESQVYSDRGQALVNNVIDHSVRRHAQGDRQKDWHWTADLHRESVPTLVPVCHATYEFEGKQYHVWLSGFDASRIVADTLPVDNGRQRAVSVSFAPFGAAIAGAAIAIFGMNSLWSAPLLIVGASLVYGVLRRKAIIGYSHKVRQTLLARRQSSTAGTGTSTLVAHSKPWLANTTNDKLVLPLIALAFAALPMVSALIWHDTPDYQPTSVPAQVAQNETTIPEASQPTATPPPISPPDAQVAPNPSAPQAPVGAPVPSPQATALVATPSTVNGNAAAPVAIAPVATPHSNVAPSFNCEQARSGTETAICADENLSRLDAQMGRSYREVLRRASPEMEASIKSEQRQWLRNRDQQCTSDPACIATQLSSRTQQLQQELSQAAAESGQASTQLEQGKLDAANECFKASNYDCSIQITRALLVADPNDAKAADLLQKSRAAQAQALQGNWNIH